MAESTIVHAEDVMPVRSRVSWGAIFAGAAIAFAVYFVLTLLGSAIGLSVRDRVQTDQLSTGAAVWAILTVALALFLGGYVTSQCTVGENKLEAIIHGVIMWGVLFGVIVCLAATTVRSGFSALVGMANVTQATTNQSWEDLARRAGVPQDRINDWQRQAKDATQEARAAVQDPQNQEMAANTAMQVAWWTLAGTLLSMIAAVGGALAGAGPSPAFVATLRTTRVRTEVRDQV